MRPMGTEEEMMIRINGLGTMVLETAFPSPGVDGVCRS